MHSIASTALEGIKKFTNPQKEEPAETQDVEDLSSVVSSLNGRDVFATVLHGVLTPQECNELIQRSEDKGYEKALVNIGRGRQMAMQDTRNSDRCIIDDPDFAEMLYQRMLAKIEEVEPRLLHPILNWKTKGVEHAVGLNERLRILRYDPGCYFKPHSDGSYRRGFEAGLGRKGEESRVTMLLYLNEGYEGGHTRFLEYHIKKKRGHRVVPRTGSVLLFEHPCYHEGETLKTGRKYIVRTDLMYTKKGPGHEYSKGFYRGEE